MLIMSRVCRVTCIVLAYLRSVMVETNYITNKPVATMLVLLSAARLEAMLPFFRDNELLNVVVGVGVGVQVREAGVGVSRPTQLT